MVRSSKVQPENSAKILALGSCRYSVSYCSWGSQFVAFPCHTRNRDCQFKLLLSEFTRTSCSRQTSVNEDGEGIAESHCDFVRKTERGTTNRFDIYVCSATAAAENP